MADHATAAGDSAYSSPLGTHCGICGPSSEELWRLSHGTDPQAPAQGSGDYGQIAQNLVSCPPLKPEAPLPGWSTEPGCSLLRLQRSQLLTRGKCLNRGWRHFRASEGPPLLAQNCRVVDEAACGELRWRPKPGSTPAGSGPSLLLFGSGNFCLPQRTCGRERRQRTLLKAGPSGVAELWRGLLESWRRITASSCRVPATGPGRSRGGSEAAACAALKGGAHALAQRPGSVSNRVRFNLSGPYFLTTGQTLCRDRNPSCTACARPTRLGLGQGESRAGQPKGSGPSGPVAAAHALLCAEESSAGAATLLRLRTRAPLSPARPQLSPTPYPGSGGRGSRAGVHRFEDTESFHLGVSLPYRLCFSVEAARRPFAVILLFSLSRFFCPGCVNAFSSLSQGNLLALETEPLRWSVLSHSGRLN
ncbi:hypothetical protein H8959_010865 [Pygathrix nigripes]